MKTELSEYISKFTSLTAQEKEQIIDNLEVKRFKKDTILLKEGDISFFCYFILKGCIREYYLIDGEEKTTAFYTEEQSVVSFTSYANQKPASHYLSCSEECVVIVGNPNEESEMYKKFPKLQEITRLMVEEDFGKIQTELATFITSSPEERYLNLLEKKPKLIQRVPQHQLASYLGVKPESLSRIRKRLSMNK